MKIAFWDEKFCCWGLESQGGTYILRLNISQPVAVGFGRFQGGEPVLVPEGDYLYVGSALAQKGAASLARRLLRHASRSDTLHPHAIRQDMVVLFPKLSLGPMPLHPPSSKKLRWHVDFLLEEAAAALTAVYFLRSSVRWEERLAHWLLQFAEVSPLVVGLGGTDDPGGTHLLRVATHNDWWRVLPDKLTTFLLGRSE